VYNLVTDKTSDILYEVTLSTDNEADMAALANKVFKLHVKNLNLEKEWVIIRTYDDFNWLFTVEFHLCRHSRYHFPVTYFPISVALKSWKN
jgi:hypothetical protein